MSDSQYETLKAAIGRRWPHPAGEKAKPYVGKFFGTTRLGTRISWQVKAFPSTAGPFVYATFPYDGWVAVLNTTSNMLTKVFKVGDGGDSRGMALFPPVRLCRKVYAPVVLRNFVP